MIVGGAGCGDSSPSINPESIEAISPQATFSENGFPGANERADLPDNVILLTSASAEGLPNPESASSPPSGTLTLRGLEEIQTHSGQTLNDSGDTPSDHPENWNDATWGREDYLWEDSIPSECDKDYTWYAATHTVTYTNADLGFEFDFRTHPRWGDESNSSNPYEVIPNSTEFRLRFGPLATFKGCDLPQYFLLDIQPARSTSEILTALEKQTWSDPQPTALTLNGNDAVLYESSGLCEHPALEMVGPGYNLLFYPLCGDTEESEVLLELAEGVRWL